mmetsp:Transcript_13829/g.38222  ORF Transcript_13829/g.38222 Transcript_13829/m.38222 type:complete len:175 (+) Transcript_13829:1822-2346(+)
MTALDLEDDESMKTFGQISSRSSKIIAQGLCDSARANKSVSDSSKFSNFSACSFSRRQQKYTELIVRLSAERKQTCAMAANSLAVCVFPLPEGPCMRALQSRKHHSVALSSRLDGIVVFDGKSPVIEPSFRVPFGNENIFWQRCGPSRTTLSPVQNSRSWVPSKNRFGVALGSS